MTPCDRVREAACRMAVARSRSRTREAERALLAADGRTDVCSRRATGCAVVSAAAARSASPTSCARSPSRQTSSAARRARRARRRCTESAPRPTGSARRRRATITSYGRRPARSAGVSGDTSCTSAPRSGAMRSARCSAGVRSVRPTPMKPRDTRPRLAQLRQHGNDLADRNRKADVRGLRADGRRDADDLALRRRSAARRCCRS